MNARLIFEHTVYIVAAHGEVNLLESAYGTLAHAGDGERPSLRVAEFLVHREEVTGKEGSLVATRSGSDFHLHILGIFGIFGYEGYLDFLLNFGLFLLVEGQFLASHLLHFGVFLVGKDIFGLGDAVQTGDVPFSGIHDVAEVLVLTCEFDESFLVGNHAGVSNQGRYLFISAHQSLQFL